MRRRPIWIALFAVLGGSCDTLSAFDAERTLSGIEVTGSGNTLGVSTTMQLHATGRYSDGSARFLTRDVVWSSSDSAVLSVSNDSGKEGLARALKAGVVTVTAARSGVTGATTLTVTSAALTALVLKPSDPTIAPGAAVQLQATGAFSDQSTQDFTAQASWRSSDESIATVSTAASPGLVRGVRVGRATITAEFGGHSGSVSLTVAQPPADVAADAPAPALPPTSIAVNPAAATLAVNGKIELTASAAYGDGTTRDVTKLVTWASGAPTVATVSNEAGSKGVVSSVTTGQTSISATLGALSGSATITVTDATLLSIAIEPTNATVAVGNQVAFQAQGTYSDGAQRDVTALANWITSDASIATVSDAPGTKGSATGMATGWAKISAVVAEIAQSTVLTVTPQAAPPSPPSEPPPPPEPAEVRLVSISVEPAEATVSEGRAVQLSAIGTYSDGSTKDLTRKASWETSSGRIARVSRGLVQGRNPGRATITAKRDGVRGSATVTVTEAQGWWDEMVDAVGDMFDGDDD